MSFGKAQTINPIVKSKSQHKLSEQWVGTGRVASPRRPVLRSGHKSEPINASGPLGDRTRSDPTAARSQHSVARTVPAMEQNPSSWRSVLNVD
jgi:hypothetical protein